MHAQLTRTTADVDTFTIGRCDSCDALLPPDAAAWLA